MVIFNLFVIYNNWDISVHNLSITSKCMNAFIKAFQQQWLIVEHYSRMSLSFDLYDDVFPITGSLSGKSPLLSNKCMHRNDKLLGSPR